MSELRWDALRGEWLVVGRAEGDDAAAAAPCPMCPTAPGGPPTEIPLETFEFAVFERRSATERPGPAAAGATADAPPAAALHATASAAGRGEVVVYSPSHDATLGALPVVAVERLIRVWSDRYAALSKDPDVRCVVIYERRSAGTHPHGRIDAYPYLPPIPARELEREREYYGLTGRCLHCDLLAEEERDGRRVVGSNDAFVAYVPFAARHPYELHLVARRHLASLLELRPQERLELAMLLRRVLRACDALPGATAPCTLVIRQAPVADGGHAGAHLRIEIRPAAGESSRSDDRDARAASVGVAVQTPAPETAAERLRAAAADAVPLEP
ncbi:MAG TPA: hypothetical protein VF212_06350 [Longimicrobiales bacterium]